MAEKKRHHFVPRFYLSAFRSAPKRIHLFGVDSSRAIQDVGIRDQCYRHRFHGPRNEVENALARIEDRTARVLRPIDSDGLPRAETDEYAVLLIFVAFQSLRTAKVADRVSIFADKLSKQVGSRADAADGLKWLNSQIATPVLVALSSAPNVVLAISDLRCHLVVPAVGSFITSDHPVFSYNQYCEGIAYRGITGALCTGLQMFVPLSPRSLLVLYDEKVYKVVKAERRPHRSIASAADVAVLNSMQLLSAHPNVYFSDWQGRNELQRLTASIRTHREADPFVVQEYGHDTDPNQSLLHSFERMPNLKLNLSFLKVRWDARSVPQSSRAPARRKEMPMPDCRRCRRTCEDRPFFRDSWGGSKSWATTRANSALACNGVQGATAIVVMLAALATWFPQRVDRPGAARVRIPTLSANLSFFVFNNLDSHVGSVGASRLFFAPEDCS